LKRENNMSIVENAFGIFKKIFWKLLTEVDLHVSFKLDFFIINISDTTFFDLKLNLMFKS
jgi:hypothetical protein